MTNLKKRVNIPAANEDDSGPKQISIFCPQNPEVKISNLPQYAIEMNNECFVLELNSPELTSKLIVNCDGQFTMPSFDDK